MRPIQSKDGHDRRSLFKKDMLCVWLYNMNISTNEKIPGSLNQGVGGWDLFLSTCVYVHEIIDDFADQNFKQVNLH